MSDSREKTIASFSKLEKASCYLVMIVPVATVAFVTPIDVFKQLPFLDQLTAPIGQLLPSIERLAGISSFPDVTRLVLSLSWALFPIQVCLFLLFRVIHIEVSTIYARRLGMAFMVAVSFVLFFWGHLFFEFSAEEMNDKGIAASLISLTSTSRIGMGLTVGVIMSGVGWTIAMICIWLWYVPHVYFNYRGKTKS